jgi:hypothetical protein
MPCKYYEQDLAVIVRCKFTEHRVCKQWVKSADLVSIYDEYEFCEKQSSRTFEPESIIQGEEA